MTKSTNPYPRFVRRILRRLLPEDVYLHHIGRHEKGSLHIWAHIVAQLPEDCAVFDVGAYYGEYAILTKQINPHVIVHAFEPNPKSASTLRKKTQSYDDIYVHEVALSDNTGSTFFTNRQARSALTEKQQAKDAIIVQTYTFSDWLEKHEVYPHIIKIDIEGAEPDVFEASRNVLENYEPIILCEVLTDEAGKELADILPNTYHFYKIDENSKQITKQQTIDRSEWRNTNWLFVPDSKLAYIASV